MATLSLTRWLAPAVFAAGLGFGALTPAPAQARDDDLVRVLVSVADVVINGGQPYYRYGPHYGYDNRLVVVYDRHHRPSYYRYIPRHAYRAGPPYGNAYGYYRNSPKYYRSGRYYDNRYYSRDRYDRDRRDRRHDWDDDDDQGDRRGRRRGRGDD